MCACVDMFNVNMTGSLQKTCSTNQDATEKCNTINIIFAFRRGLRTICTRYAPDLQRWHLFRPRPVISPPCLASHRRRGRGGKNPWLPDRTNGGGGLFVQPGRAKLGSSRRKGRRPTELPKTVLKSIERKTEYEGDREERESEREREQEREREGGRENQQRGVHPGDTIAASQPAAQQHAAHAFSPSNTCCKLVHS